MVKQVAVEILVEIVMVGQMMVGQMMLAEVVMEMVMVGKMMVVKVVMEMVMVGKMMAVKVVMVDMVTVEEVRDVMVVKVEQMEAVRMMVHSKNKILF